MQLIAFRGGGIFRPFFQPSRKEFQMKSILLLFTTLALSIAAQASPKGETENCLLGETSGDWSEMKDANGDSLFLDGEMISLFKEIRVSGLTDFEKDLIHETVGRTDFEGKPLSLKEALDIFSDVPWRSNAGYLSYFRYRPTYRQFVAIAHYPGDNEYGKIFEIKADPVTKELVFEAVANIEDGDLYDCKVRK